jgi:hypothetical protein
MQARVIGWRKLMLFGHVQHLGRVSEVEEFGVKMCLIQIPSVESPGTWANEFTYSVGAIFGSEHLTEEIVRERLQTQYNWAHPALPAHDTLRPSDGDEDHSDDGDDEDVQVVRAETLEAEPLEF